MQKGKPAKKYSQAGRVHDVIRLIESRHGITVDELAEETGVDRRTIYRDLAAVQEAGYPLISDWSAGNKVYRFLTRFKDVPPLNFSLQELMSLYFLRAHMQPLKGTSFYDDMENIFKKVNSVLPSRYAAHMERITQVVVPLLQGVFDYRKAAGSLEMLREALLFQYRIRLDYRSKGQKKPVWYDVDPYTLVFHKGGLYLLGFAHNRSALRTFAVNRISVVELTKCRFEMPESFNPKKLWQTAFGIVEEAPLLVKAHFDAAVAASVKERIWHASQVVEEMPDGGIVLSFEAGGRREIISWLLSYGNNVKVLAPAELKIEIANILHKATNLYSPVRSLG